MTLLLENTQSLTDLYDILSLRRAAFSVAETLMITKYIKPTGAVRDGYGNFILKIGESPIMWSCHTDTVHSNTKTNKSRQKLHVSDKGILTVLPKGTVKPDCLGADDGAGVWLMLRMIKAKVPGLYIFHRDEEAGGHGSSHIVEHWDKYYMPNDPHNHIFKGIKFAIAFDRKGTKSIITHQGARTCSDAFADSFSAALDMGHVKDDNGTFTDTKHYYHKIPECTNLSVGYVNQHFSSESLDIIYLQNLLMALINMDQSKLVAERDPKSKDEYSNSGYYWQGGYRRFGGVSNSNDLYGDQDWLDEYYSKRGSSLEHLIKDNAEIFADMMEEWGYTADTLRDEIISRGGRGGL